jgi:hypothetical protein
MWNPFAVGDEGWVGVIAIRRDSLTTVYDGDWDDMWHWVRQDVGHPLGHIGVSALVRHRRKSVDVRLDERVASLFPEPVGKLDGLHAHAAAGLLWSVRLDGTTSGDCDETDWLWRRAGEACCRMPKAEVFEGIYVLDLDDLNSCRSRFSKEG